MITDINFIIGEFNCQIFYGKKCFYTGKKFEQKASFINDVHEPEIYNFDKIPTIFTLESPHQLPGSSKFRFFVEIRFGRCQKFSDVKTYFLKSINIVMNVQ